MGDESPRIRGFFIFMRLLSYRMIVGCHGTGVKEESCMLKRICIIDGQGGGIGATLIKYLKASFGENVELIALGTNWIILKQLYGNF